MHRSSSYLLCAKMKRIVRVHRSSSYLLSAKMKRIVRGAQVIVIFIIMCQAEKDSKRCIAHHHNYYVPR